MGIVFEIRNIGNSIAKNIKLSPINLKIDNKEVNFTFKDISVIPPQNEWAPVVYGELQDMTRRRWENEFVPALIWSHMATDKPSVIVTYQGINATHEYKAVFAFDTEVGGNFRDTAQYRSNLG